MDALHQPHRQDEHRSDYGYRPFVTLRSELDPSSASNLFLPQFVKDEFAAHLERGICPSCGTRRMAETAAK